VRCGTTPVTLLAGPEPGLDGLRHEVVLLGQHGSLTVSGRFPAGQPWVFDPPLLVDADGRATALGEPEAGPTDPWYRANARAIAAVVAVLHGAPADARLFGWDRALALDLAAQAALGRG
jgi:hypothetical protein